MENLLEGNKYFKWYWSICNRGKNRILESTIYTEQHHIYPKSIYGENKDLVELTAKEHYIVHLVLWWGLRQKYGTNDKNTKKMCWAFIMMTTTNKRRRCINSNEYKLLRIAFSERGHTEETKLFLSKLMRTDKYIEINKKTHTNKIVSKETRQRLSESHKNQKPSEEMKKHLSEINSGKNHPQYGTHHPPETIKKMSKPRSEEGKKNISEAHIGQIPWNKGRIVPEDELLLMSERMKGDKNPNFGKKRPPEVIEKIRQKNIETKRKQREEKLQNL